MFYIGLYKQINIDRNTKFKIPNLGVTGSNPVGCTISSFFNILLLS